MHILSVINQKGGVGKTTTAGAIAAGLTRRGYSVLMVDLDAQGNLTATTGAAPAETYRLLQGEKLQPSRSPAGYIYTSSPALATADLTMTQTGKEYRLKEALEGMAFDFAILDLPPALGVLTVNALTASDAAIIPAKADYFSIQGITQLMQTINAVKKYCNPELEITGILLTMYNKRTIIQREIAAALEQSGIPVLDTKIRPCGALTEAQARRTSIFDYSPRSNAAQDYDSLITELLERM